LVIFNEKDGRYDGKSIFLKGQVIVSPFQSTDNQLIIKKIPAQSIPIGGDFFISKMKNPV
jgi:hypothetical protein